MLVVSTGSPSSLLYRRRSTVGRCTAQRNNRRRPYEMTGVAHPAHDVSLARSREYLSRNQEDAIPAAAGTRYASLRTNPR